jgi:hypothetical protein
MVGSSPRQGMIPKRPTRPLGTKENQMSAVVQVDTGYRKVTCEQLKAWLAIYKLNWDNGRPLVKEC